MMDPAQLSIDILELIKTTEDKNTFTLQLQEIQGKLFSPKAELQEILEKIIPYEQKEKLLLFAHKYGASLSEMKSFENFLVQMQQAIQHLPEVSITLACKPTQQILESIISWFCTQTKQPVLLDVRVDASLIGGAVIGYKGKYQDFSIKKKLLEKKEKGELLLMKL